MRLQRKTENMVSEAVARGSRLMWNLGSALRFGKNGSSTYDNETSTRNLSRPQVYDATSFIHLLVMKLPSRRGGKSFLATSSGNIYTRYIFIYILRIYLMRILCNLFNSCQQQYFYTNAQPIILYFPVEASFRILVTSYVRTVAHHCEFGEVDQSPSVYSKKHALSKKNSGAPENSLKTSWFLAAPTHHNGTLRPVRVRQSATGSKLCAQQLRTNAALWEIICCVACSY